MQPVDLKALLDVPYVDPTFGAAISPDGAWAAFSWNRTGQWEIYEIELGGKAAARQITQYEQRGGKFTPRYSPDGCRLAYVIDDGSEACDVWIYDRQTGIHTNLTPDAGKAIQPNIAWSPDGRELAFIRFVDGRFSTVALAVENGAEAGRRARLVCAQGGPHTDVQWSPDGGWLAITAEGEGQDCCVIVTAASGQGEGRALTVDGRVLNAHGVRWAGDGKELIFAADIEGEQRIASYSLTSGKLRRPAGDESPLAGFPVNPAGSGRITSEQLRVDSMDGQPGGRQKRAAEIDPPPPVWEESAPEWSPDGQWIAYVLSQGADTWLAVLDLQAKSRRYYQVEAGLHQALSFTPDGRHLLFVFDSPRYPPDLWQLDLASGEMQPLTRSLPQDIAPSDLATAEEVWYPGLDGTPVPALLYLPPHAPGALLPPAVVVIHGGPDWAFQLLWYPLMSYFAGQGWVVLAPNYRGSTGYGQAWQMANRFEMGRLDVMDVAAGADYLARGGLADPRRIAVTGRSHGGYLTMCCLTSYPDRWAVGSAVVPFLNWFTSHKNSRPDLQHWDIENMGNPAAFADLWRERSPFFYLERIQAPVQLICGALDPRCPASESIQAYDTLVALGKQAELLLYPDEGHTFLRRENVIDHETRRVGWLERWNVERSNV